MNRVLSSAAFIAGLAVVGWVGAGYVGSSPLALLMTALIAAVYLAGASELRRFHAATTALLRALDAVPALPAAAHANAHPPAIDAWLTGVPPSLQNAVRLRVEGERAGLPGPSLTPTLVGLLVLLGMLGTFLGMVVTLNGAVMALESTTDLPTIRAALAAPVKGLGLAFGTSVAGVAASAMLGLLSALCRRERAKASQRLDQAVATGLRPYSLAHQRFEAYQALQQQARAMPELAAHMQAVVLRLDEQGRDFNDRLLATQERFHLDTRAVHAELAASVGDALQQRLQEGVQQAGALLQPVVQASMDGMATSAERLHQQLSSSAAALHRQVGDQVAAQLAGVSSRFDTAVGTVAQTWSEALSLHQRTSQQVSADLNEALALLASRFDERSVRLLAGVEQAQQTLQADLARGEQQRQAALLQSLQTQARETLVELAALMQAAAEGPRAAAEAMGMLRQRLSDSLARDNEVLEERSRLVQSLGGLLDAVHQSTAGQQAAIEALVSSTSEVLSQAARQQAEQAEAQSARLTEAAAQVTGSAIEVASLGEVFGHAMQTFGASSQHLIEHLQRLEALLDKSVSRSDEQLAYYVAQAREVIDLSLASQKQIVDDLQRLATRQAAVAGEAA